MNNRWNKWVYRWWSPVYDRFFNKGPFLKARQELFNDVNFHEGDKVLFVGVGTGADLEQIPIDLLDITAIDYSEEMLAQAKKKFPTTSLFFQQMDTQQLTLPDEAFDYVVASLILSVVPDSHKAFEEMVRVTRSKGQMIIFDKFASKPSIIKKLIRPVIKALGTDIGLSFEKIYEKHSGMKLNLLENRAVLFGGMYRKIKIRKN
ncbi:methyltransferase domain-containing protein [Neobacillus sp. PS2-9]|uniref:class I SAM-dependent methyltransferase n=1 Tax=Neobacillus sp. PS2-9 TaxID=3070676 RepID=UPI0027E0CAAB|nr:methyltransferase domain-containing protein [Neobacillus sp. PS2-9]WML59087.1 methyltransferase domain-containing protein [Neobacillus sp. PS2-9]